MKTQYISLNMTPSGVNPIFHISQYDVGRLLGFYVYNGSEVVDLDDYTCTVEATRTDGTQITTNVITNNNSGIFAVTATMSNVADKYNCQLVIVDRNTNRVASLPFIMDVVTAALNGNDSSIYNDRTLYQQYNASMQGALANEANNRINADNLEKATRQSAVNTLQNNIDAEATARQTADNTLQGNINSEASTRASADSNLQSQINQIIAPSGEAPSAAEVQNARIGADGVTYDTLGNAIRGQASDLKSALTNANRTISMYDNEIEIAVPDSQGKRIQYFFFAGHRYLIKTSGNANAKMTLNTRADINSSTNIETIAENFPGNNEMTFTATADAGCLAMYCNNSGVMLFVDDLNDTTHDLKKAFFGKKSILTSTSFDCNQAEINSVYYFNSAANVTNAPVSSPVNGNLITFGVDQSTDIITQIFQRYTTSEPELYHRMCYGTGLWGSWNYVPKDKIVEMCFSMFQTWGIIGDSFASGVFVKASTGEIDNHLQKSWPQILARKAGNQCVNFSMGGLYCGSWLTNTDRGLPFLLSEPAKELYIIALGINDVARLSGVQPLGTISDINDDYSQNPSTFYGNYGKIIGNIQTHAPNAKIILSTIPYTFTEATSINNAILAIADYFDFPCLPVHTDKFFRSSYFWANFEQDHPKSFVYSAMANAYDRLICDSLRNDTSYWGDTFNL